MAKKRLTRKAKKPIVAARKHVIHKMTEKLASKHEIKRPLAIKVSAALYVILGITSILSGLMMTAASYGSTGAVIAVSSAPMSGTLVVFLIGITSTVLGLIEFLVGFGLWRMQKWAGTIGIAMALLSIILSIPYAMINPFSGIASLIIQIILVISIYSCRNSLIGTDF